MTDANWDAIGFPAVGTRVSSTKKHDPVRCKQCGTLTTDRFSACWTCEWLPIAACLPDTRRLEMVQERLL